MFNYIGERFKSIRIDVFEESQKEFAQSINQFILLKYSKDDYNELKFSQNLISTFENDSIIKRNKLIVLFNYLYQKKRINSSWLLLENNNTQRKFLTKIEIPQNIVSIQESIKENMNNIQRKLNDIDIIIENVNI